MALIETYELIDAGRSPEEAIKIACPGVWAEWRDWIKAILSGERSILRDIITDPREAARITRLAYKDHAKTEALRRAKKSRKEADKEFWKEVAELM